MKIIIPVKTLKAHKTIAGIRETNLALNGIFITPKQIISSDGKMILVSENKLNPQMRTDYLIKVDQIPSGTEMAVIDTDTQVCYFLKRIVNQQMLKEINLTEEFTSITGARVLKYKYPDVAPKMVFTPGKLASVKISAYVMNKLTAVAKAINSRTGEVELSFQSEKDSMIRALIRQGATTLNLFFLPMK